MKAKPAPKKVATKARKVVTKKPVAKKVAPAKKRVPAKPKTPASRARESAEHRRKVFAEANNANVKRIREFWAGTQIGGTFFLTSATGGLAWWETSNKGIGTKQWTFGATGVNSATYGAAALTNIDTTTTVALTITAEEAVATDVVVIDGWEIVEQSQ